MKRIKQVLMERDGMTEKEADSNIKQAKILMNEYIEDGNTGAASEVCQEMFGLEPDYIMELI